MFPYIFPARRFSYVLPCHYFVLSFLGVAAPLMSAIGLWHGAPGEIYFFMLLRSFTGTSTQKEL